jgi:hypothetical protein
MPCYNFVNVDDDVEHADADYINRFRRFYVAGKEVEKGKKKQRMKGNKK